MYLERSLFGVILTSFASLSFGWEYGQPREEQTNYSAWYQLPNPAPSGAYSPASAAYDRERSSYDRAPPPTYDRSQPSVYERERERERPSSYPRRTPPEPFYPEASGALPNNLLPQPRTPPAGMVVGAFYPGVQPGSPSSSGRRLTQDVATTQDVSTPQTKVSPQSVFQAPPKKGPKGLTQDQIVKIPLPKIYVSEKQLSKYARAFKELLKDQELEQQMKTFWYTLVRMYKLREWIYWGSQKYIGM